jgi:hypothetical protein
MSGGIITRRVQVGGRVENTKGTAITIGADQAKILAYEPVFEFNPTKFKRNPYTRSLSRFASLTGQQIAELTFRAELMAPPIANIGESPTNSPYLQGCGMKETLIAGTSAAFAPVSTKEDMETLSLAVWEDGIKKALCGAMSNLRLLFVVGEPVIGEYSFIGKYSEHKDDDMPSPAHPAEKPFIFQNATFTVHGSSMIVQNMEIDLQNEISLRPDPGDATGILHALIVGRNPTVTLDPEQQLVADHDFFDRLKAGTEAAISIVLQSSDDSICTIALPKTAYLGLSQNDRDGIRTYSATMEANKDSSSGDDELTITFAGTTTTSTTTTSTSTTTTTL